jgi:hypothetical protein
MRTAVRDCHAVTQVTNHAPSNPIRTPISGLEMANQNGIASLNVTAPRPAFALRKIVFMHFSLLFDPAVAIARASDFRLLLPSQSLFPLQGENQLVTPWHLSTKRGSDNSFWRGRPKSNARASAGKARSAYLLNMKTNEPAIIALVLWLLFVASNAFAVFRSPYPLKSYPPDQTIVIGVGQDDHGVGNAANKK